MLYNDALKSWKDDMVLLIEDRRLAYDRAAEFVTPLRHLAGQTMARLLCSTEQGIVYVESAKHTGPHEGTRNCHNFHYYDFARYKTLHAVLRQDEPLEAAHLIHEDIGSPLPPSGLLQSQSPKIIASSALADYYREYAATTNTAGYLLDLMMDQGTEIVAFQPLDHRQQR